METKESNWYLFSSYCAVYLIRHCPKLISFNLKIWKWCILNTIFLMRKLRPREVSFLGAPVIKVEWTISRFLSSTLKIKCLILWNSALFYIFICICVASPYLPHLFLLSKLSDALVILNLERCWGEGEGWLQRPWQLSYKTACVILFALVIFNIFIGW